MNLQPVNPKNPDVYVVCAACGRWASTSTALADIDADPGTYYHYRCRPGGEKCRPGGEK